MELNEFIKSVIVGIHQGVEDSRCDLGRNVIPSNGVRDVPCYMGHGAEGKTTYPMSNLEFEVVLTEVEKDGGKAGIGVFFGGIGIGAKKDNEDMRSSLSKIRFNIPIVLP